LTRHSFLEALAIPCISLYPDWVTLEFYGVSWGLQVQVGKRQHTFKICFGCRCSFWFPKVFSPCSLCWASCRTPQKRHRVPVCNLFCTEMRWNFWEHFSPDGSTNDYGRSWMYHPGTLGISKVYLKWYW
jgi:hypothetical protein